MNLKQISEIQQDRELFVHAQRLYSASLGAEVLGQFYFSQYTYTNEHGRFRDTCLTEAKFHRTLDASLLTRISYYDPCDLVDIFIDLRLDYEEMTLSDYLDI